GADARPPVASRPAVREPLLAVDDLRVQFWTGSGTVYAVNGMSFGIRPGETLGIVGESGCGKSVTALALLGLLPRAGRVRSGTARFEGRDLLQLKDRAMRRLRGRQIAMIFQDPMTSLNPVLTIGRQLREPLETHFDMSRKEATSRATELLERVGIPSPAERISDYPHHPCALGLLQSGPRLDATRRAKLQAIEGVPRDMLKPPSACPFQPRCRYEVELSRQEVPPLVEIEPGHKLACFNPVAAEEWERTRVAATA